MKRSPAPVLLTALGLLVVAGCEDRPITAPGPDDAPRSAKGGQQPPRQRWTSDDEFARVARAEVPGFAGYYFDDDGTPVILLKDHRQREAAERYLAPQLARARRGNPGAPGPVVRKVTHDFAELKGWFEDLLKMDRDDVHMLDVDEVENKVFIGVRDEAAIRAVRREAARLGVPPGALKVEVRQRPKPRITLRDWTSVATGGFRVEGAGGCTLGFNAVHQGAWVFVTNSHCTTAWFAYDGVTFYQPTYSSVIGSESVDQPLFYCSTPTGQCRYSDAAYVYYTGRNVGQGKIAYTRLYTANSLSTPADVTVLGYYDIINRYTISGGDLAIGTRLYKTGQASGTTTGTVTASCVTVRDQTTGDGRNIRYDLACQDVSKLWSQHGDSGSPMYYLLANGQQVFLYGILWGGPENPDGTPDYTTTWSSRLEELELDNGTLSSLCVSGYGC
jgi:hypothetical protein